MITKKSQEKLQEIRASRVWCCIDISSDFDYVWKINLTKYEFDKHDITFKGSCYSDLNKAVEEAYEFYKAYSPAKGK